MSNFNSGDDYSDENELSSECSDNSKSDDSTYGAKKGKKRSSTRAKSKKKCSKKKSHHKSKTTQNLRTSRMKTSKKPTSDSVLLYSEDSLSQMSDINPRTSRSHKANSTTSTLNSGLRKTISEPPVLIIIDSDDSDYERGKRRPSRSARVQGEMIRKLGLISPEERNSGYSSSSSNSTSKKKVKRDSLTVSANAKLFLSSRENTRRKFLRRSKMYATQRLKIKSIHTRFNKNYYPVSNRPKRQSSLKSEKLDDEKSSKRRLQDESESDKQEEGPPPKRKIGRPRKKVRRKMQEASDFSDIENDIRKITSASKPNNTNKRDIKTRKSSVVSKGDEDDESLDDDSNDRESVTNEKKSKRYVNEEQLNDIESDLEKINASPDSTVQDEISEESEEETKPKNRFHRRSKINKNALMKKKNAKLPIDIKRRRGRPRLTESKPPEIVLSNTKPDETISFLNIKAQVPFLQNSFCFDVAQKIPKCRECRLAVYRTSKRMYNSYCRFMEYRKLCYTKHGIIITAGFSNPCDATSDHLRQWLPHPQDPPKDLNYRTAKALMEQIGDQFCDLVLQEEEALQLHVGLRQPMTWKRIVQGVREMCDVCSTTIFNIHWVCPTCGFAVCIDCYKVRKQGIIIEDEEDQPKDRDEFKWLMCTQRSPHTQDSLVMAQMIPGQALWIMKDLMHRARKQCKIVSLCQCSNSLIDAESIKHTTGVIKQLMSALYKSFDSDICHNNNQAFSLDKDTRNSNVNWNEFDEEVNPSALRWYDMTHTTDHLNNNCKNSDDSINRYEDFHYLSRKLLQGSEESNSEHKSSSFSLAEITNEIKDEATKEKPVKDEPTSLKGYKDRYPMYFTSREPAPIQFYTNIESQLTFPGVPHSWFCNGRLLFLHKAHHEYNLPIFQALWRKGQPIVVQGVDEGLDMSLWHPDGFCRDFGEVRNDLVDCKTGTVLKNLPMKKFWEGFENFNKRLTDENGEYMLLKLKDWPPGEDFSEKLPTRFEDLMKGLPLPEYTHRNGILNLAGRLPSCFVRPDLGPKMYNAYGSALYPQKGTTNLHLDISDAVNVMVYVGIPSDGLCETHIFEALNAIDEGGCDSLMKQRVTNKLVKPGALWHIYNAKDADKIRDMLTKVAIERGDKLEAHHDPIHDQSWYIDSELRSRLSREYGVEGYAIAQCLGDAVFIPAGAPHQVRNLHSCVKVAEDFVSSENIAHCFKLTQEFRNLSDTHTNHEDKLQIKNIIYHVVKDSLSILLPPEESIR